MVEKAQDNTFDPRNSRPFDGVPSWDVPLLPYGHVRTDESLEALQYFESMEMHDMERKAAEDRFEQSKQIAVNKEWNQLLEPIRLEIVSAYGSEIEKLLRLAGAATFKSYRGAAYRYYERFFDQEYPHSNSQPLHMWVAGGDKRLVTDRQMDMVVAPGFFSGETAAYSIIARAVRFESTPQKAEIFDVEGELTGENRLVVSVGLENESVGPFLKGYTNHMYTFWVGDPNWRDVLLSGVRYFYRNREVQGLVVKSSNTRFADTIPGSEPGALH